MCSPGIVPLFLLFYCWFFADTPNKDFTEIGIYWTKFWLISGGKRILGWDSVRSSSSGSCPSSVSWGRLRRTYTVVFVSRQRLSVLYRYLSNAMDRVLILNRNSIANCNPRREVNHSWSACSRTPTCALSTLRESPSCQRTSSSPGGSGETTNIFKAGGNPQSCSC